jgi:hypothetical protein
MSRHYQRFQDFYPVYLSMHQHRTCRLLHYIGSLLGLLVLLLSLYQQSWWGLLCVPIIGYGFAWCGHVFFEKNRPATLQHPLYSFAADWLMLWQSVVNRAL